MGPPQEKKNIQCTIYNHVILYKASITVLTQFGHISLATEQIIKCKLTSKNNNNKKNTLFALSNGWGAISIV